MAKVSDQPTLVLLDAHALIHRAYHAVPPLNAPDGRPINAVYGFASTIIHVIKELSPTYLAIAFDEKGPIFRDELFAAYKGTRAPTPDDLKAQFPIARELATALGLPYWGVPGFEADDLIGTLAKQAQAKNIPSMIVTGDQDLYQLVNHLIRVYNIGRGLNHAEVMDEERVKEKYGLSPSQLVDYKALRGDSSDNIPGVPGVGPKTAQQLISQFGSLEKLYEVLNCENPSEPADESIKNTLRFKLCEHQETAFLSKKLATIVTEVPIALDLAACRVRHYNEAAARELFERLGFKSLLSRLPKSTPKDDQTRLFE